MKTKNEKGTALLATVIVIMSVILASGVAMVSWSQKGYKYAVRKTDDSKMFYISDSGIKYAVNRILGLASNETLNVESISNDFMSIANSFFPNDDFKISSYTITEVEPDEIGELDDDEHELVGAYDIRCRVEKNTGVTGMPSGPSGPSGPNNNMMNSESNEDTGDCIELSTKIGRYSVSILDYGVYYQDTEMVFNPEKDTEIKGKVHSNNGLHLGPIMSLRFYDYITSAEDVTHEESDRASRGKKTEIATEDGEFENMCTNTAGGEDEYITSEDPKWKNKAEDKFKGNVKSKDNGDRKSVV